MKPTLVVLAAGMGSRYGGLKQVDPVGPSGEAILDYSVFDAVRGGFGKVVFIIRKDFEAHLCCHSPGSCPSRRRRSRRPTLCPPPATGPWTQRSSSPSGCWPR